MLLSAATSVYPLGMAPGVVTAVLDVAGLAALGLAAAGLAGVAAVSVGLVAASVVSFLQAESEKHSSEARNTVGRTDETKAGFTLLV